MNEKWFALSVKQTEAKLKTNAATGLSRKAARSRASQDGKLFYTKKKKAYKMLLDVVSDFALVLLLITVVASILFDEGQSPVMVLALTLISIVISFIYYYRSQRAMESMNMLFRPTARVIRNGKLYRTDIDDLVVGDVILLERGDVLGCDARIVTSDSLSVMMRVDKNRYEHLSKTAECAISENEKDPRKMKNILHAGSVIEQGSARAIAVATGKYTYLGALTGGIAEPYSDNVPSELKKIRGYCSRISLFSMICILPFCIVSLLFGHIADGEVTLSSAFLTALAITVSAMSQLVCTHFKVFFVRKIKKLLRTESPVAIRTTNAFDKLADMKYLFLLDGASLTDGILHFDCAFTAEGEVKSYGTVTSSTRELFEYAFMYRRSDAGMLTVGTREPERYSRGLDEFLLHYRFDTEALKIRRPVRSYMAGNSENEPDKVFFSEAGRGMILSVSHTPDIISNCAFASVGGQIKPLNSNGTDRIKHAWNRYSTLGKKVLIFTVSTMDSGDGHFGRCFIGMVVLRESVDKTSVKGIASLERAGVKVVSFVGGSAAPGIPVEAQRENSLYKSDLVRDGLKVTHRFGEISTYYGFDEKDILNILRFAQSKGDGVGVVGFTDYAPEVIQRADVFISCADISLCKSGMFSEELKSSEPEGASSSSSCIQTVKAEADVLIRRPSDDGGGLASIADAVSQISVACRNLSVFFRYLIGAWISRICLAAVPMIIGYQSLDARHLLLLGFVLDFFALHMFATDETGIPDKLKTEDFRIKSFTRTLSDNAGFIISTVVASLSAVALPRLVGLIEPFGKFECLTEYAFLSAIWIHMGMLYYVRYGVTVRLTRLTKNKYFIGILVGAVLFSISTLWNNPVGSLFGFSSTPVQYFAMSFLHLLVFLLCVAIFKSRKNKQ